LRAILVSSESPVTSRIAEMLSEVADLQLEIEGPNVDAVQVMTRFTPDVVVIDIDLTKGHGLEIIKKFHQGVGDYAPVIMAIAISRSLRYRATCLEAGAMYYFNAVSEQQWLLDSLASIQEQLGA
jgi:chemotaxis response regulator CheB